MTELTDRRREAALDRDLNVARIADALERLGDLVALLLEPEPREDERENPDDPDTLPAQPEDTKAWRPVKGGRAVLREATGRGSVEETPVAIDRLYESEGILVAVVVDETGKAATVPASILRKPRA